MNVTAVWKGKLKFVSANSAGHTVEIDGKKAAGGDESAQGPKELVLSGLAGCTAMDVISILGKMHALPEGLRVEVEAQQTAEHPKIFKKIHLKYVVKGEIPEEKLKRAIQLSQERYCGVSEMMRKSAELTYEYLYEK